LGINADTSARDFVLDFLITQTLIVQQAESMGIAVDLALVEAQVANAKNGAGSDADFQAWLDSNFYTIEEFNAGIYHELLTQQLNAQITANVPFNVTQIRARYIQVDDPTLGQTIRDQILNGGDFAALANQHSLDRHTGANGGDLGYFAPNTLLVPAVENAAFALGVGETSEVIPIENQTLGITTYYIIQTTDISDSQPLDPSQRNQLLAQTFADWLANIKTQATIEIFVP
jgi:parvulin-like peptidyl-prolyl isomerase